MAVAYTSGSIHFSGLGSDTDFDTMITELKKIESAQKNRFTLWQADWNKRISAFQKLNTSMLSLSSTLSSMNTMNKFLLKSSVSSNENIMTATATSAAQNNSNKVEVNKLATNAAYTWEGSTFSSTKDKANPTNATENFVYTYKGKTVKVAVGANATMEQFINQINSDANNPGVRASLIKSGSDYIFQIQGQDTGASATLTIDATSSSNLAIKPPTEQRTSFGSNTAVVNSSGSAQNFVYQYDGSNFTISVADGDTLEGLKNAINSDPNNPGVTADVVNSNGQFSLKITPNNGTSKVNLSPNSQVRIEFNGTGWNTTGKSTHRTTSDLRFDKNSRSINESGNAQNFVWADSAGSHTLSVAAGTSLSDLATQINSATGTSTRAEICKDSAGYYLQLTDLNPNSSAAPEIDQANSSKYLAISEDPSLTSVYTTTVESYTQYSQGFSDANAVINHSGSDQEFKYSYAGKTYSVTLGANATLQDLVNGIKANTTPDAKGNPINSLVDARVGCDGENSYRLYLSSKDGNTTEKITIASDSSSALEIAPSKASWTNSGNTTTYNQKFNAVTDEINSTNNAQTFKFIDGSGNTRSVSVAAGGDLQSLITAINAGTSSGDTHGVTASTVTVDGKLKLQLNSSSGPVRIESTSSQMLAVSPGDTWSSSSASHSITFGNFSDAGATINPTGTTQDFVFLYKDKQYEVALGAGATLQNLVDAINGDATMNTLVEAKITGSNGNFQFVLAGKDASPATPNLADGSSGALAIFRNTASSYINKEKNTVSSEIQTAAGNVINSSGVDQKFVYTYNGVTGTLTVPDGCTMEQFIDMINTNKSVPGVYASAEDKGGGKFVLHLSGSDPSKTVTVSPSTSKADNFVIRPPASTFTEDNNVPVSIFETPLNGSDVVNSSGKDQKFTVEYMGKNISITVAPGDTVDTLIGKLNSYSGGQIKANLFTDGSNQYLQLWGTDPADVRPPQVSTTSSSELLISPPDISSGNWYIQMNSNAQIKLNDWPSGADNWIESETNSPTELIEGVNLTLKSTGTSQVTISTNDTGTKDQIVAFIDALNSIRQVIKELTGVDTEKSTGKIGETASNFDAQFGSILTGNYGVQLLSSILKSNTASQAKGFAYQTTGTDGVISGDLFTSLAHIGITTCAETNNPNFGMLTIDEETLDKALAQDPQAVAELFAADNKASVNTSDFSFSSYISGQTQPGAYEFNYTIDSNDNILDPYVMYNGQKYKANWDSNTNQITVVEGPGQGLAIGVNNTQQGNYKGTVTLKMGKVGELSALTNQLNKEDGIVRILQDNYQNISDNIQKKIDREEERLILWERTMRAKFARLEAVLSTYNGLSSQLESTIKQLSSNK